MLPSFSRRERGDVSEGRRVAARYSWEVGLLRQVLAMMDLRRMESEIGSEPGMAGDTVGKTRRHGRMINCA